MDRLQGSPEGLWVSERTGQVAVTLRKLKVMWAYQVVGCTLARGGLMVVWNWCIPSCPLSCALCPSCGSAPLSCAKSGRILARKGLGRRSPGVVGVLSLCAAGRTIRAPVDGPRSGISHLRKFSPKGRRGSIARCIWETMFDAERRLAVTDVFVAIGNADCVLGDGASANSANSTNSAAVPSGPPQNAPKKYGGPPGIQAPAEI